MAKPQETVRSQLRIPHEMHEAIKAAADSSGRSINAEIVHRLGLTLASGPVMSVEAAAAQIAEAAVKAVREQTQAPHGFLLPHLFTPLLGQKVLGRGPLADATAKHFGPKVGDGDGCG